MSAEREETESGEETMHYYDIDASALTDGQIVKIGGFAFRAVIKCLPLPNGEYVRIAGVQPLAKKQSKIIM